MDAAPVDVVASLSLIGCVMLALGANVAAGLAAGRPLVHARVEREAGLPIVGRAPMHAIYRALIPIGRGLVALGIGANALTVASLVIACGAAFAFASGHFGFGAAIAAVAALADGLDGFVARLTNTQSRFGQVLDTLVDRYVDALFLGGIAVNVRSSAPLLALVLAALVGGFMVSYASSVERELQAPPAPTSMRRAHRLTYLVGGAALAPFAAGALQGRMAQPELLPVFLAVAAIAVVGNVSAVRRLLRAGRHASALDRRPHSEPPASAPEAQGSELPADGE